MTDDILTPAVYLLKIQKMKYKFALIPFLMVISSFILSLHSNHPALKLISFAGLIGYLILTYLYRVKKIYHQPENSAACTLAPVNGKVISIDDNTIKIQKKYWQFSEIRNPAKSIEPLFQFSPKVEQFEESSQIQGKLIGFAIGNVVCNLQIPKDETIQIQLGESVIAGVTILSAALENA
jgi:hypothetical protein